MTVTGDHWWPDANICDPYWLPELLADPKLVVSSGVCASPSPAGGSPISEPLQTPFCASVLRKETQVFLASEPQGFWEGCSVSHPYKSSSQIPQVPVVASARQGGAGPRSV